MDVHVIGDEDTVLGITLAGGSGTVPHSPEEADEALSAALQQKEIRLLLVTWEWSSRLSERMQSLRMRSIDPIVLEIPGKQVAVDRESVDQLVRRAIGISL
ncbi:V-type ATP synthase subunit F [Salinispira pacifica]